MFRHARLAGTKRGGGSVHTAQTTAAFFCLRRRRKQETSRTAERLPCRMEVTEFSLEIRYQVRIDSFFCSLQSRAFAKPRASKASRSRILAQ
jgi:hypothetical protein